MGQLFGSVERMTEQLESDRKSIRRHVSELEFANREIAAAQEAAAALAEMSAGEVQQQAGPAAARCSKQQAKETTSGEEDGAPPKEAQHGERSPVTPQPQPHAQ